MRPLSKLYILFSLAVISACAKQSMPTGGPKDITPPVVMNTVPDNGSTNFKESSFYVEFDEYVNIKDAENNILVSPPMTTKPVYKTKGHGIVVNIKDTLQPNTTYLFQFKDAIADYNEGNLLPSMEYVFSTGDFIDSMMVDGRVVDALTMKPREETISVWLMHPSDGESFLATRNDSAAPAPHPAYITRCNKDGSFVFSHIKPGDYNIFAVNDENKNQKIESNESMAFMIGTVAARYADDSTSADSLRLMFFSPNKDKQRITSGDFISAGKVRITSLLPMANPVIDAGGARHHWIINATRDTLTLWTHDKSCDSLRLVVSDTTGIQDTLKLRWTSARSRTSFTTSNTAARFNYKELPYFDSLCLLCSAPLDTSLSITDSAIVVMDMKDSSLTYCQVNIDSSLMRAVIAYPFADKEKYEISLRRNRLRDIQGKAVDSLHAQLTVKGSDQYGNITIEIVAGTDFVGDSIIVELLDEKGKVVESQTAVGGGRVTFEHVVPSKYSIRAIVDRNGNGHWDPGSFDTLLQPEPVIYLPKQLEVRANWDFEELFRL